jgi:hypothetical protein
MEKKTTITSNSSSSKRRRQLQAPDLYIAFGRRQFGMEAQFMMLGSMLLQHKLGK